MEPVDGPLPETLLPDELLETFRERAAGYDRGNRFFDEDFADLVRIGYPLMLVPREHGGLGLTLEQAAAAQRRLASAAPATANVRSIGSVHTTTMCRDAGSPAAARRITDAAPASMKRRWLRFRWMSWSRRTASVRASRSASARL